MKTFQLKKKTFVRRQNHNLLTNNEEVVNGTDSFITWERKSEPERATLNGKKCVNKVHDHRFYATLASHWTFYWNFLFFFLNEKGKIIANNHNTYNLSAPDLREASGTEVLKVNFIKYYSLLRAIIPQYPSLNKRREKLSSACKGLLLREEIYRKCINCSPFKGNT